ncbi:MAG: tetratricopeptide repeat protein [Gloeotrichia echinulata CP02]|nr:tetratricopeptide repeat protein [Gloeotrichia echinulata DEX184]
MELLPEETAAIEAQVLKPYRRYKEKLRIYEQALVEAIQREHFPLSQSTSDQLKHFRQVLGLREEDIAPIVARIEPPIIRVRRIFTTFIISIFRKPKIIIGAGIVTVVLLMLTFLPRTPPRPEKEPTSTANPTDISTPTTIIAKEIYERGLDKYNQQDYTGAIEDFNQALQLEPNNILAYYQRGYARAEIQDYKGAIEDFNQYMQHNPNDVDALDNRGNVYYNLGKYEQAITDLNKAIQINPKDSYAYNMRGLAYNEQGKYEKAIADYNKAIELKYDPLSVPYNNRGNAYDNLGNYQKAIEDYNQAIRINPNDADAFYNLGNTHSKLGDKQAAVQYFQKAAQLYQKQGQTKDHQETLERIKKLQQ